MVATYQIKTLPHYQAEYQPHAEATGSNPWDTLRQWADANLGEGNWIDLADSAPRNKQSGGVIRVRESLDGPWFSIR